MSLGRGFLRNRLRNIRRSNRLLFFRKVPRRCYRRKKQEIAEYQASLFFCQNTLKRIIFFLMFKEKKTNEFFEWILLCVHETHNFAFR